MNLNDLPIHGAKLLTGAPFRDSRGVFEVFWDHAEMKALDISFAPINACHSYNLKAGILRGLHFQQIPHGQTKLVSCVSGAVWDVMVDLRPSSPTYKCWHGEVLDAGSGRSMFIPAGCAHGFLTLKDETTIAYLIEGDYVPDAAGVVRWNDPAIGVQWPDLDLILSERDRLAPDFIG